MSLTRKIPRIINGIARPLYIKIRLNIVISKNRSPLIKKHIIPEIINQVPIITTVFGHDEIHSFKFPSLQECLSSCLIIRYISIKPIKEKITPENYMNVKYTTAITEF